MTAVERGEVVFQPFAVAVDEIGATREPPGDHDVLAVALKNV